MSYTVRFIALVVLLFPCRETAAQQILVDRGIRAADLWCFPVATDSTQYLYVPGKARLGTDDEGNPRFSFVRYSSNAEADDSSAESIVASGGGAVLTFLVTYDTPAEDIEDAQRELR